MSKGATSTALKTGTDLTNKYQGVQDTMNTQLQSILGAPLGGGSSILPGVMEGYSDISSTGGYDPSVLGRLREGYSQFATTGGITPESEAAITGTASKAARSSYDLASADAARRAAITGGYGYNPAIQASLARKGSQAASEGAQAATAQLAPLKQQGQLAGLGGMGGTEQNLISNRLAGLGGGAGIGTDLIQSILANYANMGNLTSGLQTTQAGLAKQPGFGTNLMNAIMGLGGAAGGALTGWGASGLSDRRAKKDIKTFKKGIDIVRGLHPVSYVYNDRSDTPGVPGISVVAQDAEKVLPKMVFKRPDGLRMIDSSKVIWPLVSAVKHLDARLGGLGV